MIRLACPDPRPRRPGRTLCTDAARVNGGDDRLTRLRLKDFHHETLALDLDGRHVCLFGPMERARPTASDLQLGPAGLRSAKLTELTRHGAPDGWTVSANSMTGASASASKGRHGRQARDPSRWRVGPGGDLADLVRMSGSHRHGLHLSRRAFDRRRFFDRQVMSHIPPTDRPPRERAMRERNALWTRPCRPGLG